MSLVAPRNGSNSSGQSRISRPPTSVVGRNAAASGRITRAPAASAALAMPLSVKQLAGSLIGLSDADSGGPGAEAEFDHLAHKVRMAGGAERRG